MMLQINSTRTAAEEFDYVIVGAGSAGCVLANRLSADPNTRVLLLEAGGSDWNPWIHIPAGYYRNTHEPRLTWDFETEPVAALGGRRLKWPRGKVVGGSGSINGLIFIRGQRQDFDHWRQLGNVGWSFAEVLPYFLRAERDERCPGPYHSADGPLRISNLRARHELHEVFIAGAREAGHRFNNDFNGAEQEGIGYFPLTIRGARRCSTAVAYLRPALRRSNLKLAVRSLVLKVIFEDRRAVGVEYQQDGTKRLVRARGEVVLAAGAINSPQLLQLSGIGPAELLSAHGIGVVHHLAGVGENLQDHLAARIVYRARRSNTLNEISRSATRRIWAGLQYLLARRGPLMMGAGPIGLFARTRPELVSPDVEYSFLAGSLAGPGGAMHDFPGCQASCIALRPESRGWVRIRSNDAVQSPAIQPNYLSTQADRATLLAGVRIARRIFRTSAMQEFVSDEVLPGPKTENDQEFQSYIANTAGTTYHPSCTCMMGANDQAVVDSGLRVRGIEGLRVVDASIMPTVVSGNTNATVVMIAEKGAEMIRQAARP